MRGANSTNAPLRMLVIYWPGQIEGLLKAAAGVDDFDTITAIAARYYEARRAAVAGDCSFNPLAAEIANRRKTSRPPAARGWRLTAAGCLYRAGRTRAMSGIEWKTRETS